MFGRHARALVGLSRDTYRYESHAGAVNLELRSRIVETAHSHRRWGYRRTHDVLRPQFPNINNKRVYRTYTSEGLSIRKRKKTKRIEVRVLLVAAMAVNQTWFVSDTLCRPGAISRRIKCLTVTDDFTRECGDKTADFGAGGHSVTRLLDRAETSRGYPKAARTDNRSEFTCRAFMTWTQKHSIQHILIESGSPTQNAFIESFNGTFTDECLNENWSIQQCLIFMADVKKPLPTRHGWGATTNFLRKKLLSASNTFIPIMSTL